MIKTSLIADQERKAKLNKLGDALQLMAQHVDFAALAAPRPSRERGGQMIDASIVEAPRQSLSKEEKAIVSGGAMPADWKPAKRRQKDMDARWTKKHGKSYFGRRNYVLFEVPLSC